MDLAAQQVFGNDEWTGDTADAFDSHRVKVTGDAGSVAAWAGSVADALDQLAYTLSFNQGLLDEQRAALSGIRVTYEPEITFHPADDTETRTVNDAITAAREIRTHVDEQLVIKEAAFASVRASFDEVAQAWAPRSVRVLNLNIQQGGVGNKPWPFDEAPHGTDRGDIDELGQVILDSGADVATLQETFEGDMGRLRSWLEEETGDTWDLHFAAASDKIQHGDGMWDASDLEPFGNAILVRHSGDIESSEELPEVTLQEPAVLDQFGRGTEGRSMEGATIQLAD